MSLTRKWPEPKVVVIGGGSGISTILPGLKKLTTKLTAIITVSDDGGSTGRLREDLGIVAPGDIRNCLVSLSNVDEDLRKLFDYRFESGELKGHSFGNLFIAAMNNVYGDFGKAVYKTADILTITGKVLPITLENTHLVAKLENGEIVFGESHISKKVLIEDCRIDEVHLEPTEPEIFEDAKKDILNADYIIMGPGSLYTSIIPNLLAKDMTKLIQKSKAKVVYIANAVSQHGETDGYTVKDHYEAIIKHAKGDIIDVVIANKEIVDSKILKKYEESHSNLILPTEEEREYFNSIGVKLIEEEVVEIVNGTIRHDCHKLAELILSL